MAVYEPETAPHSSITSETAVPRVGYPVRIPNARPALAHNACAGLDTKECRNPTWCQSAAAYCALSVLVSLLNAHVVTFLPSVTLLLAVQAASTCLALALASRVPPREVCVGAVRAFPATFV